MKRSTASESVSKTIEKFLKECTVYDDESVFWSAHSVLEEVISVYCGRILTEFGGLPMVCLSVYIVRDWFKSSRLAIDCEYVWNREWVVASSVEVVDVVIREERRDITKLVICMDESEVRGDLYSPNVQAMASGLRGASRGPGRKHTEARVGCLR